MKIIQITPSYKPAYIYGGPIMSVAKLCEALAERRTKSKEQGTETRAQSLELKDQNLKTKDLETNNEQTYLPESQRIKSNEEELKINDQRLYESTPNASTTNEQRQTNNNLTPDEAFDLEVFTTLANGKTELNVKPIEKQLVDGVAVTYFKRITKDHTHFSPALLQALRSEILSHKKNIKVKQFNSVNNSLASGKGLGGANLIVHIHAWWNLVSIFSCFIAKWYKIPVVLSPRGMLTSYTKGNRNGLAKKIIHKTIGKSLLSYCHIHATSEMEKQNILSFIQPKNITVIPNLVELGKTKDRETNNNQRQTNNDSKSEDQSVASFVFRPHFMEPSTNNEQRPFKLIFISRIEQKKGLELLFEALAELEIDWHLTIAGTGKEEYVEKLKIKAKSLKLGSKIDWIGQVKNEDKFKLLAENNLLVLTSYNENFANVVIESLSVGTPVLISNQVGLADYVEQNDFGWIAELNPNSIKDEILSAYQDIESRTFIRGNAPKVIATDFSDNLVDRYIKLYQTIL